MSVQLRRNPQGARSRRNTRILTATATNCELHKPVSLLLLSCRMVPLLHPPDGFVKIGQIDVGGKEITFSRTILTVPWSMPEHNAEARG